MGAGKCIYLSVSLIWWRGVTPIWPTLCLMVPLWWRYDQKSLH